MLKIFLAPIGLLDPDDGGWKKRISEECWGKSRRWKSRASRARAVGAELLLNWVFKGLLPEEKFPLHYERNSYGKKYLKDHSYHFNVSHSGDYVACALSDQPVGIDIQECRTVRDEVVQRFFAAAEQQDLAACTETDRANRILSYWVLKESYVKMLGKGLTYLRKGCFLEIGSSIRMHDKENPRSCRFQLWEDIPNYRMAVCVDTLNELSATYNLLPDSWMWGLSD